MAIKHVEVAGLGTVRLQKRRGTRNLRITLTPHGEVRVSLPAWAPYHLGIEFAKNKQTWITQHRREPVVLTNGQLIGKSHRLLFVASQSAKRVSTRLRDNTVRVTHPIALQTTATTVQQVAQRGAIKALQAEAESLLPTRLQSLATRHGFRYRSLRIKHLRAKWGSCDHLANITLNVFLMTLPWELIDYVLLHELMHTKVLRHGPPFWQAMATIQPNVQERRKQLRQRQPSFNAL